MWDNKVQWLDHGRNLILCPFALWAREIICVRQTGLVVQWMFSRKCVCNLFDRWMVVFHKRMICWNGMGWNWGWKVSIPTRVRGRSRQQLSSSLNRVLKPFLNGLVVWQFDSLARLGSSLSFVNQLELGLARLKPNRSRLGRTSLQTG